MNENLHGRNSLFENRATSPGLLVKALFVSLACHVLVFLALMYLPDISLRRKPPVPSVMNVTMVNLASPGSAPKAGPIAPESSGGKAGNGKIAEPKPAPPKQEPPKREPPKAEAPKPAPEKIPEPPKPAPPKPEPPKPAPKPAVKEKPPEAVSLAPQKPKEKEPEPAPPKPPQPSAEKSLKETLSKLEKKVAQPPQDPLKSTLEKLRSTVAKEEAAMPKSSAPSGTSGSGSGTGTGGSGTGGSASLQGGQGGDSATGIPGLGLQAMQAIDFYRSLIGMTIEKNWFFSDQFTGGRKDLATVIVIKILPNGQIADIWYEKKSGNTAFDDSAFKAVKKSNPLPPLPKEYTRPYYEVGLVFTPAGLNKG